MTGKPNPHRGEVSLVLGGTNYKLIPSFEHLSNLEEESGISILDFAQRIHNRTIKIQDLAAVIATTAHPPVEKEVAARGVMEEGLVKTIGPISKFFANALMGGQEGNVGKVKGE